MGNKEMAQKREILLILGLLGEIKLQRSKSLKHCKTFNKTNSYKNRLISYEDNSHSIVLKLERNEARLLMTSDFVGKNSEVCICEFFSLLFIFCLLDDSILILF